MQGTTTALERVPSKNDRVVAAAPELDAGMMALARMNDGAFETRLAELKKGAERIERVKRELMKDGTDYGTIPGTPKPTIYKPGAEKLSGIYRLVPSFEPSLHPGDGTSAPAVRYIVHCRLHAESQDGAIVGEGMGSCNSWEKKYRSRDAYDLDNTLLKMAEKRAYIDAVLRATASSGLFTQDLEDVAEEGPFASSDLVQRVAMLGKKKLGAKSKQELYEDLAQNFDVHVQSLRALTPQQAKDLTERLAKMPDFQEPRPEPSASMGPTVQATVAAVNDLEIANRAAMEAQAPPASRPAPASDLSKPVTQTDLIFAARKCARLADGKLRIGDILGGSIDLMEAVDLVQDQESARTVLDAMLQEVARG